jgi:hypothetical protein
MKWSTRIQNNTAIATRPLGYRLVIHAFLAWPTGQMIQAELRTAPTWRRRPSPGAASSWSAPASTRHPAAAAAWLLRPAWRAAASPRSRWRWRSSPSAPSWPAGTPRPRQRRPRPARAASAATPVPRAASRRGRTAPGCRHRALTTATPSPRRGRSSRWSPPRSRPWTPPSSRMTTRPPPRRRARRTAATP